LGHGRGPLRLVKKNAAFFLIMLNILPLFLDHFPSKLIFRDWSCPQVDITYKMYFEIIYEEKIFISGKCISWMTNTVISNNAQAGCSLPQRKLMKRIYLPDLLIKGYGQHWGKLPACR